MNGNQKLCSSSSGGGIFYASLNSKSTVSPVMTEESADEP